MSIQDQGLVHSSPPSSAGKTMGSESILIVDDNPQIRRALRAILVPQGYTIVDAKKGEEALELIRRERFALILLDVNLPGMSGIETCKEIRRATDVPVMMLTVRDTERDKIQAFDAGADDYIVKPFGRAELLARIRAVLRRMRAPDSELLRHGDLEVDIRTCKVTLAGREIEVTPKEFDILACLMADPGRVITREQILEHAWDAHWYGPMKVLDVHVASLRRKLARPGLIETVYGRGFRLADRR
jgi:DNA-binding response OmpR family regulator